MTKPSASPPFASEWEALDREILACRRCPRLVEWREQVAREKRKAYRDWDYWGRPLTGFGDRSAGLLILGRAPSHGRGGGKRCATPWPKARPRTSVPRRFSSCR